MPPPNDLIANREALGELEFDVLTVSGTTVDADSGFETGAGYGPTVWYEFDWPWDSFADDEGPQLVIDVESLTPGFLPYVEVYKITTDPPVDFTDLSLWGWIGDGTEDPDGQHFELDNEEAKYVILVTNWDFDASEGDFELRLSRVRYPFDSDSLADGLTPLDWYGNGSWGGCLEGSLVGNTSQVGEPAHGGFGPERSVWFRVSHPVTGTWKIWVDGPGDMVMSLYSSTVSNPTSFAQLTSVDEDDSSGPGGNPEVQAAMSAGTTYVVAVDCKDAEGTNFKIYWDRVYTSGPAAPANDLFANAESLGSSETLTSTTGTTQNAHAECDEPPEPDNDAGPTNSVWYKWIAPRDGSALFQVRRDGGTGSVHYAIWRQDGTTIRDLVLPRGGAGEGFASTVGQWTSLIFPVEAGKTYYFQFQHFFNEDVYTTFSIQGEMEAQVDQDNDDWADAEEITGEGTYSGDIEGATLEDGEQVGTFQEASSSVWYKYTPASDCVIRMRAFVTPRVTPTSTAYDVSVWEGTTLATLDWVPGSNPPVSSPDTNTHWLLRGGTTYYIQVTRRTTQAWSTFDLKVDLFPEEVDWDSDDDGWGTLSGSAALNGDFLEVTDALGKARIDIRPSNSHIGKRCFWTRFTLELVDMRGIHRGGSVAGFPIVRWYNEDDTLACWLELFGTPEGHQQLRMRRSGGTVVATVGGTGETTLVFGHTWEDTPKGEGEATDIEIVFIDAGLAKNTDTTSSSYGNLNALPMTYRYFIILIGGKTVATGSIPEATDIRYVDVGASTWPTTTGVTPITGTLRFGHLAIRDNVAQGHPGPHGFADEDPQWRHWDSWLHDLVKNPSDPFFFGRARKTGAVNIGSSDIVQDIEGRGYNSLDVTCPTAGTGRYYRVERPLDDAQKPRYAGWVYFTAFPDGTVPAGQKALALISGVTDPVNNGVSNVLGALVVDEDGTLWLTPWLRSLSSHPLILTNPASVSDHTFCIARLETDTLYWIEVEIDKSVSYDVKCTVTVNDVTVGPYSNRWRSFEKSQHWNWVNPFANYTLPLDADNALYGLLRGNPATSAEFSGTGHWYMSMWSTFRKAESPVGPCEVLTQAGVSGEGTHNIPEWPVDETEVFETYQHHILFDWEGEIEVFPDSGTVVSDTSGPPGWETDDALEYTFGSTGTHNFSWNDATGQFFLEYDLTDLRHDYIIPISYAKATAGAGAVRLMESLNDWTNFVEHATGTRTLTSDWRPIWNPSYPKIESDPNPPGFDVWLDNEANATTAPFTFRLKPLKILKNPKVYPQYRWTDDNGSTHTLITPGETDSAGMIGSDPTASTNEGVFMDNHASYDRVLVSLNGDVYEGDTRAGFTQGEIMKAPALDMLSHYVEYTVAEPGEEIKAAALWTRQRSYSNWPSTSGASSGGAMHTKMASAGKSRMITEFSTSDANVGVNREVVHTSPEGLPWTAARLGSTSLQFGFWRRRRSAGATGDEVDPSPWAYTNYRFGGVLLHAAEWEMVVGAEPGPSVEKCLGAIHLSMIKLRSFLWGDEADE